MILPATVSSVQVPVLSHKNVVASEASNSRLVVIIGAASQNHMHVSSSKNYNMLSNATGCPNHYKNLHKNK